MLSGTRCSSGQHSELWERGHKIHLFSNTVLLRVEEDPCWGLGRGVGCSCSTILILAVLVWNWKSYGIESQMGGTGRDPKPHLVPWAGTPSMEQAAPREHSME